MNWDFLKGYECTLSPSARRQLEDLYELIGSGHPRALDRVHDLLRAQPMAGTSLKGMVFVIEASLEQMLIQLPESRTLKKVLFEMMRRPESHWLRSREGFLEAFYMSKPDLARRHFLWLLVSQQALPLWRQAQQGDRVAMRTLLNLMPRRALVAGMCEQLLDHPTRAMFLQELWDSFHDLDWLKEWSPRWRAEFGSTSAEAA
jgi:hypothetical protein